MANTHEYPPGYEPDPAPEPPKPTPVPSLTKGSYISSGGTFSGNLYDQYGRALPAVPSIPAIPAIPSVPSQAGMASWAQPGTRASYWSTAQLQHRMAYITMRLFTCGQGSCGQGFSSGLSISETNMQSGGCFYQNYACTHMTWELTGGTMEDRWLLYRNGTIYWELACQQLGKVPLATYDRAAGDPSPVEMGGGLYGCVRYDPNVMYLPTGSMFAISVAFGSLNAEVSKPVNLKVTLHGNHPL